MSMSHFIGLNWDPKSFSFPDHYICVIVSGKKVNRGASFGLEIPCRLYILWR